MLPTKRRATTARTTTSLSRKTYPPSSTQLPRCSMTAVTHTPQSGYCSGATPEGWPSGNSSDQAEFQQYSNTAHSRTLACSQRCQRRMKSVGRLLLPCRRGLTELTQNSRCLEPAVRSTATSPPSWYGPAHWVRLLIRPQEPTPRPLSGATWRAKLSTSLTVSTREHRRTPPTLLPRLPRPPPRQTGPKAEQSSARTKLR